MVIYKIQMITLQNIFLYIRHLIIIYYIYIYTYTYISTLVIFRAAVGQIAAKKSQPVKPIKTRKFLKPSKEGIVFTNSNWMDFHFFPVLLKLEKKSKEMERRTCRMCGKKESAHRHVFITCKECVERNFPRTNHYCFVRCQIVSILRVGIDLCILPLIVVVCLDEAWKTFHDEEHACFNLGMDQPPDDDC